MTLIYKIKTKGPKIWSIAFLIWSSYIDEQFGEFFKISIVQVNTIKLKLKRTDAN